MGFRAVAASRRKHFAGKRLAGPARARKQMGGENSRTEVKAEVMAEVLQRLETQQAKVEARLAKTGARPAVRVPKAPGVPASKTNLNAAQRSRRTTGDAPASGDADQPMRGATGTKQAISTAATAPPRRPATTW